MKNGDAVLPKGLKQTGIFLGWILGLFLIGGLTWFFTQPMRTKGIIRNINSSLRSNEETRQLGGVLVPDKAIPRPRAGKAAQLGTWYTLVNSVDRAVVFSFLSGGMMAPCVVFFSPTGEMSAPIPLGVHSVRVLERLPQGVLQTYMERLQAGEALLREKE
jgi:hypothetical protein